MDATSGTAAFYNTAPSLTGTAAAAAPSLGTTATGAATGAATGVSDGWTPTTTTTTATPATTSSKGGASAATAGGGGVDNGAKANDDDDSASSKNSKGVSAITGIILGLVGAGWAGSALYFYLQTDFGRATTDTGSYLIYTAMALGALGVFIMPHRRPFWVLLWTIVVSLMAWMPILFMRE